MWKCYLNEENPKTNNKYRIDDIKDPTKCMEGKDLRNWYK